MALLPEGKAESQARLLDWQEGLRLHEFPQLAAPVSDQCMREMLGNTQHVRAAAAAWVFAFSLVRPSTAKADGFIMQTKLPDKHF